MAGRVSLYSGFRLFREFSPRLNLKQSKNKFENSRVFNPQLWGFFELSCSPKTSIYGIVAIYEHKFGSKPPKMSPKTRTYLVTLTFEVIEESWIPNFRNKRSITLLYLHVKQFNHFQLMISHGFFVFIPSLQFSV